MVKKANKAKRPKDKYYQLAKEQVRRMQPTWRLGLSSASRRGN
jgi:hypothetical protein